MAGVASACEACDGKRFTDQVLTYELRGHNIADVEARDFFTEKAVRSMLGGCTTSGSPTSRSGNR